MTAYSSVFVDYLGEGLATDRPTTLSIAPTALGFYYATDTKALSIWNNATPGWDGAAGTVAAVVAGTGLNVGAGPGGTITASGTLNIKPATTAALGGIIAGANTTINVGGTLSVSAGAGGVSSLGGETGSIAVGAGLQASSNTLTNIGVIQFGTDTGTIHVGTGLSEASSTLTNAGIVHFGGVTGDVTLGANLTMSGQTLVASGGTGTVSSIVAGTGLGGGTITTTGTLTNAGVVQFGTDTGTITIGTGLQEGSNTLTLQPATTAALGGIVAGSNVTIDGGGTISVATPGSGSVTTVDTGAGLSGGPITSTGTIVNTGVIQFGTDTGTIAVVAPLHEASGSLSLNLGAGLGITSSTLDVIPATTAALGGIIAGANTTINVGGTLSVAAGAGGVSSLGGEVGSIAVGAGLQATSQTLSNTGVLQFGTDAGTIAVGAPLHEASSTLSLNTGTGLTVVSNTLDVTAATTAALGGVVVGTGIGVTSGTISNSGVLAIGATAGSIVLGPNLSMSGQTLEVSAGAGGVTSVVAGLGLAGGTITTAGTITLDVATTAALGGVIVGSNLTINAGGTLSSAAPGTGTVTSVATGAGLSGGPITGSGTIVNAGVIQFGTDTGTIAVTAPLQEASGSLTLNYGTGLGVTSSTLDVTAATTAALGGVIVGSGITVNVGGTISSAGAAAPGAGLVSSSGATLEVTTLLGATWNAGTLTVTGTSNPFLLAMTGANAGFILKGIR